MTRYTPILAARCGPRAYGTRRVTALVAAIVMISAPGLAQEIVNTDESVPDTSGQTGQPTGRYWVTFARGTPVADRVKAAQDSGVAVAHTFGLVSAISVVVPNANALAGLQRNPRVTNIQEIGSIGFGLATGGPTTKAAKPTNPGGGGNCKEDPEVSCFDGKDNDCNGLIDGADPACAGGPPPPGGDPVNFIRQLVPSSVQRVGPPTSVSHGQGIGVVVIDSGIDFNHPELMHALAPDSGGTVDSVAMTATGTSFNAVAGEPLNAPCEANEGSPQNPVRNGHGTHVAGLIVADNDDEGIVGVAPLATIYCVKVFSAFSASGTEDDLAKALEWVLYSHDRVTPNIPGCQHERCLTASRRRCCPSRHDR